MPPTISENKLNRRRFLQRSALGATTLAIGASRRSAASPNDKVSLALIGAGGRGTMLIQGFLKRPDVHVEYVCDPEDARAAATAKIVEKTQGSAPKTVRDMRKVFDDKSIDAIVIATPEQWHALATVWACQAGKDVYVEKNVSLTIWEGRKMIDAARKYNKIVQAGTQNRSAPCNFSAREFIKAGKLGKIQLVKVYNLQGGGKWAQQADSATPAGLDWDLWLGPAKEVPYNVSRHRGWGDYFDYEGGTLAGDGSHELDMALMVLGDPAPPKAVNCYGGRFLFNDGRETPDLMEITYDYPDWVMTMENSTSLQFMEKIAWDVRDGDIFPYWPQCSTRVEIYGSEAIMYMGVHGGGWQVFGKAKTQSRPPEVIAYEKGKFPDHWHQENFIECVKSRKRPNADIEIAHGAACLVHLANAAYRSGNKKLAYDVSTESFSGESAANRFLKPRYRKGYALPEHV